jgi:hypothetical protein
LNNLTNEESSSIEIMKYNCGLAKNCSERVPSSLLINMTVGIGIYFKDENRKPNTKKGYIYLN